MVENWRAEQDGMYSKGLLEDPAESTSSGRKPLQQLSTAEIPSGILGLRLSPNDHIVLFVLSTSESYVSLIADFVAAGLRDARFREVCTLELAPGRTKDEAVQILRQAAQLSDAPKMDIVTWDIGTSAYANMHFSAEAMHDAFHDPMYEVRSSTNFTPYHCLRIASEDASQFVRGLSNPKDYLYYEAQLGKDLERAFHGTPYLQLCMYKRDDLLAEARDGRIPLPESVLALLVAHNRVIVVDEDEEVLFGNRARKRMLRLIANIPVPRQAWINYVRTLARVLFTVDRPSVLERIRYVQ